MPGTKQKYNDIKYNLRTGQQEPNYIIKTNKK